DARVLALIRRYLEAGMMADGVVQPRQEGTPQGGPLSPLLSRNLMQRGLTEERAWSSACNQRGPWWNAGASHMHAAFPKSWFDTLGLVSLLDTVQRLQRIS